MSQTLETIPSLSTSGWIDNPVQLLERAFLYYISTDSSRITLQPDSELHSLKGALASTSQDPNEVADKIKLDLTTILKKYFITADVKTNISSANVGVKIDIEVQVKANDNNTYNLDKSIVYENGLIINFQEILRSKREFDNKEDL